MYTLIIEDKNDQSIADEFSFSEGSFYIGRVEGNDIILPSNNVSRRHSRLFVRDGKCFIEDLGSSNGVYVDSQRIQGEHNLGSGAQIRIGDYYLYLEYNRGDSEGQSDVVSTHIVSQDANAHKLIRVRDAFAGEEFVLSEIHNTIGRTDENYILLNDQSISRRHAIIENTGLVYSLQDLGSSNGTSVNGRQVSGSTVLKEGDTVRFGNVEFVFVSNETPYDPNTYAPSAPAMPMGGGGINMALLAVVGIIILCVFTSVVAFGA
ncbi:MAG: FHA domain-containing protein, partial [Myxococcota bacterium]